VDVGQQEDGRWTVIEVGDPQFAGVGHISVSTLYQNLRAALAPA
jgi:hypothetical protein